MIVVGTIGFFSFATSFILGTMLLPNTIGS